jgi:cobalt/nickel transport system permease protein
LKHSFIDEYSRLDSVLHRRDPRVKIGVFFTCILFIVLTPAAQIRAFFMYFLLLAGLVCASGIPPRFILKRSLEMMPIVLCIAAFVPFAKPGVVIFTLSAGPVHLPVTHTGLLLMWNVLIKAYLSIVCSILLINTTDFADLLKAFERLRVPGLLVMIISFMYRYLFVIEDELERINLARQSRAFRQSGWLQIKTLANIVGVLFIRSYEKAEVVYTAMCCRGYTGTNRTIHVWRLTKNDLYFLAIVIIILITIRFSGGA